VTNFSFRKGFVAFAVERGVQEGLAGVALIMSKTLRTYLSKRGTGRKYRISKGKKSGRNLRAKGFHVASAPGAPPAPNTNRLRASWTIEPISRFGSKQSDDGFNSLEKVGKDRIVYRFGSNVVYARALEYGYPARKLAPRPYVRPVVDVVIPRVQRIMAAKMKGSLR